MVRLDKTTVDNIAEKLESIGFSCNKWIKRKDLGTLIDEESKDQEYLAKCYNDPNVAEGVKIFDISPRTDRRVLIVRNKRETTEEEKERFSSKDITYEEILEINRRRSPEVMITECKYPDCSVTYENADATLDEDEDGILYSETIYKTEGFDETTARYLFSTEDKYKVKVELSTHYFYPVNGFLTEVMFDKQKINRSKRECNGWTKEELGAQCSWDGIPVLARDTKTDLMDKCCVPLIYKDDENFKDDVEDGDWEKV